MSAKSSTSPWYSKQGSLDEVIVSSRIRIARNLEDFSFPEQCNVDQRERIQSLIIDSCNKIDEPFKYDFIPIERLDNQKKQLLAEQGLCSPEEAQGTPFGVIQTNVSGQFATTNFHDHLRLTGFSTGLSINSLMHQLSLWEMQLSNSLKFAKERDFGYMTNLIRDCGSGVKVSLLVHLPGLTQSGVLEKIIRDILSTGFLINGFYGSGNGNSIGDLYQVFCYSSEMTVDSSVQTDSINQIGKVLHDLDEHCLVELQKNRNTFLKDQVIRAFSLLNSVLFLSRTDFLQLISAVRIGLRLKFISNISLSEITSLYYDTGVAALQLLDSISLGENNYKFEPDILSHSARLDRLRAQVVQNKLKKAKLQID